MARKPKAADADEAALLEELELDPAPKFSTDPKIQAQLSKLMKAAAEDERKTARKIIADILTTDIGVKDEVARDFIIAKEFDRKPQRQPQIDKDGKMVRVKRDGTVLDLSDPKYWTDRYGSILPKNESEGDLLLALATEAVGNLSLQAQLVKKVGNVEMADKLMALAGGSIGKIVEKPTPSKSGKQLDSKNPWRSGDAPGAEAARIGIITRMGAKFASDLAKAAGVRIDGRPLQGTIASTTAAAAAAVKTAE